jgi:ADP-ribosylglycohydrolase
MHLSYDRYLDQILGGWIGKSMGGAIGARFEGHKGWIEISPAEMFPPTMPPNDDLDLQVLWLKVLEEKGPALTSDDLAAAWLEGCWYPFNEYGIFRRNWRLGIHPPMSGRFTNQFWETGEGCPIRAEIWGYVFPGAPDLAAEFASKDGTLDHTEQSVGAEKMLAAMASMAFFVPDVRRLASMFIHYLPAGSPIERLTRAAFQAYDEGLSLREARDRIMALAGLPEACDAQINIPFTFLGLLYGGNDLQEVMLSALKCGYDTDCTLASAAALVGQILGASRIPKALKEPVGDELVMGIEYRRPEMTLSALARDTARVGVLLARAMNTGVEITGAPALEPFPATAVAPDTRLNVVYNGLPAAAPGETVAVTIQVEGQLPAGARLEVSGPAGWGIEPAEVALGPAQRRVEVTLHAPASAEVWPMRHLFTARLHGSAAPPYTFGVAGAGLWRFLGVYYDPLPDEHDPVQRARRFQHHFVSLQRPYLPEPDLDVAELYRSWSRRLGRPALLPSYEHELNLTRLVGLRGPYCAYLARTVISPSAREAWIVIGNNDGYRLWLNGELIAEVDECTWWTPFNNAHKVSLRQGPNELLLKLVKRGDDLRFTLGLREVSPVRPGHHNVADWLVDLADAVP